MNIVDFIFPKICAGCHKEGSYICSECQRKIVVPEQICPMCCRPSLDGWTHPRCRSKFGMERLIVGLPYKGLVQACLKKTKYKSAWDIVEFLYGLCDFGTLEDSLICGVPMWNDKERVRGFNQADILAGLLARTLSGDSQKVDLLVRIRETKPMFGLDRQKRKENIDGAFAISKRLAANDLQQDRVILVDDVWTTGSTMRECARVLKLAGVTQVWGLTLAR